jgi:two-component system sensor histidine kinase/response regulator
MVVSAFAAPNPDTEFTVMWLSDKRLSPPLERQRGPAAGSPAYFDWVTLRSLRTAINLLQREHFDVILLHLPLGDEAQAVAELKVVNPAIPILVLLELDESGLSRQAYQQGADAVLRQDAPLLEQLLHEFLVTAAYRRRAAGQTAQARDATQSDSTEARFPDLLAAMPLASVVVDTHGAVLFANEAAQRQFRTDQQAFGRVRLNALPEAGTSAEALIELPGGKFQCRIFSRDITWHAAPALLLNILDLSGIATRADLDQRDRQLHEYELRFSSLAEMVQDAVVLFDRKGQAIYHGPHFSRLYPGPESRLVRPQDLLDPADGAKLDKAIAEMLSAKSRHRVRMECRTKPWRGTHRWVEVELSDYGLHGAGTGVLMMLQRDVTDRHEAQLASEQAISQLRAFADQTPDFVLIVDDSGNWQFLNRAFRQRFGIGEHAPVPSDVSYEHPDDLHLIEQARRDIRSTGEQQRTQYRLLTPDGETLWIDAIAAPLSSGSDAENRVLVIARDVTRFRQVQHTLEQREAFYRLLTENIAEYIKQVDAEGRVIYASPRLRELAGLAPDDEYRLGMLLHPDDRDAANAAFSRVLAGQMQREILRWQLADGTLRWVDFIARPTLSPDGQVSGALLVYFDVTEDHALRRRSEALEQQLKILIEASDALVQIVDAQGGITYMSPAWTRLTGLSASELTGQRAGQLLHPEDRAEVLTNLERGLLGEAMEFQHRLLLPDGSIRFMQARGTPLFDADGKPDGGLVINTDVTELMQQSMQAVNRARFGRSTRLRAILERSQALIYEIDTRGLLVYVNARFCEFLGRTRAELMGRPIVDYVDASQRELFLRRSERQLAGEPALSEIAERLFLRADKQRVWLHGSAVVLKDAEGKVTGVLGIGEDTSERLERQAQLQQALEQARSAEQAKSDFLAVASHELRTPLNAMVGTLYQLRQQMLDTDAAERVDRLQRSAARLKALVDDILDLTRLESSQAQLVQEPFALAALVNEARTMFADQAAAKGLELELRIKEQPEPVLIGDELRLGQALINLVGNAIKFTERGSVQVLFEFRDLDEGRCELLVQVRDSGPGLSAEQRAGLFRPFAQADRRQSARLGGTGLGLAIVRRIALAMDGEVGVESEPGVGSTFWFSAQLTRADQAQAQTLQRSVLPPSALDAQSARERLREGFADTAVLLVEDDLITRMMLRELLEDTGLQVEAVDDGLPALERMRSAPLPALILIDMQMLEMNGPQATREIRKLPGCGTLPIIGMSANTFDEDRQACLDAGMTHFMTKPVDPDALYQQVLLCLEQRASEAFTG